MLLQVAVAALVLAGQPEGRQDDFASAARQYGVPVSVLLGVSYLQSRWDAHPGEPSTAGGFGPMHLLDPSLDPSLAPSLAPASAPRSGGRTDGVIPRTATSGHARAHARAHTHGHSHGHSHAPGDAAASGRLGGAPRGATLDEAARLTGIGAGRLRREPAANIRGGAALLASYRGAPSADPGRWHGAVARYGGSRAFADEVLRVIRAGAVRRADDGSVVRLTAHPGLRSPGRAAKPSNGTECPRKAACRWLPAAYARTGGDDYGNHDRLGRPRRVDYIVIHDTEGPFRGIPRLIRDPEYVSWHYTIRSRDGHVTQHLRTRDVAWHAGNWDVNARSIGIEHEGYLAAGGTWYTEAMYRASARLVRHLAAEHDIPLDRAHVLGHDNVPGATPDTLPAMHEDPGPYWDWAHYFDLLGAPLEPRDRRAGDQDERPPLRLASRPGHTGPTPGGPSRATSAPGRPTRGRSVHDRPVSHEAGRKQEGRGRVVVILPEYDEHRPRFTGCERGRPARPCPPRGASTVWLRTAPRHDAPLVDDIGKRVGRPSTYSVHDHSARASAGQRFAVAGRHAGWTAIWYLGRRAWFHDPYERPTAVRARNPVVVPRRTGVPVYGRAYPEKAAYRGTGVAYQRHVALPYRIGPGQAYTVGGTLTGSYLSAAYRPARHVTVTGRRRYHQIQLGHRVAFVKAEDVRLIR
ncbi:peptidoglycan recognition family protein [Nonomuraea sp. MCN248]|uniref:N-acetylmuramoyl-L-alanine amidase n=1 Tax=Nonomuraea corallina TaxID=2989783 RepID=A0ABT4SIG3_9ACTN|nr:peptidoglycan recognition family protein [Nonomuraea corallina]MDA0636716.1 peptidoglycan recognition family protein [Nonomuraea corallina]